MKTKDRWKITMNDRKEKGRRPRIKEEKSWRETERQPLNPCEEYSTSLANSLMAQNHLQLHGQPLGNGEEASGGNSSRMIGSGNKMRGWLELKKIIAQKNCQGKDLSSQLIQHSHSKFMTGLRWVCAGFAMNLSSTDTTSVFFASLAISRAV